MASRPGASICATRSSTPRRGARRVLGEIRRFVCGVTGDSRIMSAPPNMRIEIVENEVVYTRVFAAPRDLVFMASRCSRAGCSSSRPRIGSRPWRRGWRRAWPRLWTASRSTRRLSQAGDEPMIAGGLSEARLGRMHDVVAGHVEGGHAPGLVTLVSRRGEVHVDAIGTTAVGGNEPMRRDTIFRISSMTKPVTAAAAMILVEECKLRLDEPVDRLLPELADRKVLKRLDGPLHDTVPAIRPITVRDLFAFTMGFGIVMAPPDTYPIQKAMSDLSLGQGPPSPSAPPAPDEWIRRLGTLPLMHQPGERWMYNTR